SLSSAATTCISDVPGLARHRRMPQSARVWTRLSAPFMADTGYPRPRAPTRGVRRSNRSTGSIGPAVGLSRLTHLRPLGLAVRQEHLVRGHGDEIEALADHLARIFGAAAVHARAKSGVLC